MGFRETIARMLPSRKSYPFGSASGSSGISYFEMQTPPSWTYQSYLKAYGELGTLFACVNVIAQATARVPWHLYQLDPKGERSELFKHELIDLLNYINPFQTRYQFVYMGTIYKLLVGEEFWKLNLKASKPYEIWQAPPAYMAVVPSAQNYIDHYEFRRGSDAPRIMTTDEIIHIKTPNPLNEYRGLSPAQALTVELDTERYAAQYQQKRFFNEAIPPFFIEYPLESMPPPDQRKEIMQEWDERHRGYRNTGKTGFLWGGKANVIAINNQQMQYAELRKFHRDAIMAAYHVPPSKLGIVENVNRANAVEADYDFSNNCVLPELVEIRESLNKELTVFYGHDLYLDFENPVPRDVTSAATNSAVLFKAGIVRRNEARAMNDLEPDEGPEGDEYFVQPSPAFAPGQTPPGEEAPPKAVRRTKITIPVGESKREEFWKGYVGRAESFEAVTIVELQKMYYSQKQEALIRLNAGEQTLIDLKAASKDYSERMSPVLRKVMASAVSAGRQLIEAENPHKNDKVGDLESVLSRAALAWLKTRIGWAAAQIGEETAARLAQVLADGYEQGLGIREITAAIEREFDYFSDTRAIRIARTEIMQASAQGSLEGYRDSGVVEKVEFYTALDERTCDDCMALHGELFNLEDSTGVITVHPNCRCVWLPVVENA